MVKLASAALFAGFADAEIRAILAVAFTRRYKASGTVITADTPATHLYVVKSGSLDYFVVTEAGQRVLIRRMVPGDTLGVAALLTEPAGYLGTATAVRDLEILGWERRVIRQLARDYPRLAENALRIALHYIAVFAERHARLVSHTAKDRLACALTSIGSRAGHPFAGGVEVEIRNQDLASLADVGLFTACRLLKQWERKGTVAKGRGKILIRCPERLLA